MKKVALLRIQLRMGLEVSFIHDRSIFGIHFKTKYCETFIYLSFFPIALMSYPLL